MINTIMIIVIISGSLILILASKRAKQLDKLGEYQVDRISEFLALIPHIKDKNIRKSLITYIESMVTLDINFFTTKKKVESFFEIKEEFIIRKWGNYIPKYRSEYLRAHREEKLNNLLNKK